MIYLLTALYAEAHPIISHFHLKKDTSYSRFQVFFGPQKDICLTITGPGAISAATALGSICTQLNAGQGDFLVNMGICASIGGPKSSDEKNVCPIGNIFLCNKIKEQSTGRTFYPDILYRHRFREAQIITGTTPYSETDGKQLECDTFSLYDMEAAAVYQAGSYYFGPHQMIFLKVISDKGDTESEREVTSEKIQLLMGRHMENIADYLIFLKSIAISQNEPQRAMPFKDAALEAACPDHALLENKIQTEAEKLCLGLHCSQAMSASVRQYIRYLLLSGIDPAKVINDMYQTGKLPCKDKREGKLRFEEFKQTLL